MIRNVIVFCVVVGMTMASPLLSPVTSIALPDKDSLSLILKAATALIGLKFNALSIAVAVIEWLVSNAILVVLGAIATLGFCKITGKCTVLEDLSLASLKDVVTSEDLNTAEKFFYTAVEKYAERRKRNQI